MANENKSAQRGADKPKRNGWRVFGRVIGTIVLVGVLTVLVFACLFALYVKNDLAAQNDFSLEGFALDQTSVIYYEDPKTGQDVVLQKLYGGAVFLPMQLPSNLHASTQRPFFHTPYRFYH